jgi:hypothetical protein
MSRKLKNIGYVWAALATPVVLLTMLYNDGLGRRLAAASGFKISPRFSGGEIVRTTDHGGYRTSVHRPVFDGLTGDREKGFIQVDWEPVAPLPETLREELDVYGNAEKLSVILNTVSGTARCENDPSWVSGKPQASRYRAGWIVRIGLKKRK